MRIDTSQRDVEIIGDIKEFKTSIDPKNLEFITTLLSSNLYSDPEQSFIREIVSNAWDSHVEAGTTDIPVIVRFKKGDYKWSITIRDYGVGLSPERFLNIYCNIGSSTKRESNEFIGGFGIGRFSALACSDSVYITSYYKGTAYYYIMIKSGNSITTNLLLEKPTEEKDGVEVTIKNINELPKFVKALQCITFFPNVYVDGIESYINNVKLKYFTNFAASSHSVPSRLLLGNVLYPIEVYHLNSETKNFIYNLQGTGIVIKFNIGELDITPNRENIIYTSDTIKKIEDRILAAKAELEGLINKKIGRDYDDIIEYYNIISQCIYYDPIKDEINDNESYYRVRVDRIPNLSITYKSTDLQSEIQLLTNIVNTYLPNYKGIIYNDTIYKKRLPWAIRTGNLIKNDKVLILNKAAKLTGIVQQYLKDFYSGYSIVTDFDEVEFKNYIDASFSNALKLSKNYDLILKGVYESLQNNAKKLDLNTDKDFLDYKARYSADKKAGYVKDIKEAILYVWNNNGWYKEKKTFKTLSQAVNFIKELKRGVLLTNMDSNDDIFCDIAKFKRFVYIKARKDIVSHIRSLNLKCIVDLDWVLSKDPTLSVIKTMSKHFPNGFTIERVNEIIRNLDNETKDELYNLCNLYIRSKACSKYRLLALSDSIPYDEYTEHLCLKFEKYIIGYQKAASILKDINSYNHTLIDAVIMKTKAYRISRSAYEGVKNNKLINILCRK